MVISDYGIGRDTSPACWAMVTIMPQKKVLIPISCSRSLKGFMFSDDHVVNAINRLEKNSIIIVAVSNKLGRFGEEKSFRNFCAERGA